VLFQVDVTLLIEILIVLLISGAAFYFNTTDAAGLALSITQSLVVILILLMVKVVTGINYHNQLIENEIFHIKEYLTSILSVQPFDVISRIHNLDYGRNNGNQKSIVSLLSDLYNELLVEGRKERPMHVLLVRSIFVSEKINEFVGQVRSGISEGTLTFKGSNSINITKELYALEGSVTDAISYPSLEFWKSNQGQAFLSRNKEALLRGVNINRYFIVSDTSSKEEIGELCESLKLHFAYKIKYNLKNYNIYLVKKFKTADIKSILDHSKDLEFSQIPGRFDKLEVPDVSLISNCVVSVWNFGVDDTDLDEVRLILRENTVEKVRALFDFFRENKIELPNKFDSELIFNLYLSR
jgi:hypothetical protein